MILRVFLISCLMCFLACSQQVPPRPSGFLGDYSQLRPSRTVEGVLVYVNESKPLSLYKMVMIDPVEIRLTEDVDKNQVKPSTLQQLARYFENELRVTFKDTYPIVNHSGYGVLRIKSAITNITPSSPLLNITTVSSLTGVGLGGASMEMELIDTQTGERVVAVMGSESGRRYQPLAGGRPYQQSQQILREWALLLKDHMDQAKGLHSDSTFRTSGSMYR